MRDPPHAAFCAHAAPLLPHREAPARTGPGAARLSATPPAGRRRPPGRRPHARPRARRPSRRRWPARLLRGAGLHPRRLASTASVMPAASAPPAPSCCPRCRRAWSPAAAGVPPCPGGGGRVPSVTVAPREALVFVSPPFTPYASWCVGHPPPRPDGPPGGPTAGGPAQYSGRAPQTFAHLGWPPAPQLRPWPSPIAPGACAWMPARRLRRGGCDLPPGRSGPSPEARPPATHRSSSSSSRQPARRRTRQRGRPAGWGRAGARGL